MSLRREHIPPNILRAAERAGLKMPHWYVGRLIPPSRPRKHTVESIIAKVRESEDTTR
jgi:hypothetical protein